MNVILSQQSIKSEDYSSAASTSISVKNEPMEIAKSNCFL